MGLVKVPYLFWLEKGKGVTARIEAKGK